MNNIIIHKINDLSDDRVVNILKNGLTESLFKKQKLHENYLYSHKDNPANIFNILKNDKYKIGAYYVLADEDDNYVASAGWNQLNPNTALLLTRMVVSLPYKTSGILGQKILPMLIEKTSSYDKVWMACNEYNLAIQKWFTRKQEGKSLAVSWSWPEVYKRFEPIGKHTVNGIEQYVFQLKK
jgi:hypothetical protein